MNSQKQVVQFEMEDGSPVYVEIDQFASGSQLVADKPGEIATARSNFTDALQYLKPAVNSLMDTLRDINMPNEINLEFGVKFDGRVGAIFASAGSEANFRVSLKWTNEKE